MFEGLGYILEESDDDLDESSLKENPSVHRQMITNSYRDNAEERDPESQPQEAALLSQLNP